jgi:Rrf2 family protein
MVQITRETDYAIRCVVYLSGKQGITMVDEISKQKGIPKSFLAKILQKLVKASLVKSYRGIKGGFELSRPPAEISLLDVIEAVEGPIAMNACAVDEKFCTFSNSCTVHPVWLELRREVEELLRKKTFADLAPAKETTSV